MENIVKLRAEINEAIDRDDYDESLVQRLLAYRKALLTLNGWVKREIPLTYEVWQKDSAFMLLGKETFTITSKSLIGFYWYDNDHIFAVLVMNL